MNLSDRSKVATDSVNVVSLFSKLNTEIIINDPSEDLVKESRLEEMVSESSEVRVGKLVNENQFPDQSIYILEEQLSNLRFCLNRIKFYLGDIEDLLPR